MVTSSDLSYEFQTGNNWIKLVQRDFQLPSNFLSFHHKMVIAHHLHIKRTLANSCNSGANFSYSHQTKNFTFKVYSFISISAVLLSLPGFASVITSTLPSNNFIPASWIRWDKSTFSLNIPLFFFRPDHLL